MPDRPRRDVGRRLKYFVSRFGSLNVGNMVRKARQISKKTRKPTVVILADMAWCAVRYEAGYYDYHEFEYFLLNHKQRKTVLTRPRANNLVQQFNPIEHRYKLSDKSEFNRIFSEHIGREWLDVREADAAALEEFVTHHGRVMAKSIGSVAGRGIEKLEAADISDYAALRTTLLEHGQFLVEEYVTQHPALSTLSPDSVNTLRIVSFLRDDTVHILARVLKMGTGAEIDNFSSGGVYTTVDETGLAHYGAFDKEGYSYEVHPQTRTPIVGFQVPLFDEVIAFVDTIARVVPEIPYVGWDIAVTPDGPVVIEGNYNTGVFWMKPSMSGVKTGLLPEYKRVMGF